MKTSTLRSAVAALVIAALAFSSTARPAKADTTSTLLITAAAVAALATGINVAEKNAKANTVVGYLRNGSVVFADGHVVAPNGQSWYPGNVGESIACNGQYCSIVPGNGYGTYGNNGYPGYVTGYNNYAPAYGGYAPTYNAGYYPQSGNYYGGSSRTVNTYVNTVVTHRVAPVTPVHRSDPVPVPVRATPKPIRMHPDNAPPQH